MNMVYSKDGLALTKHFESCRLIPYYDVGGCLTNGWGNTHNVVRGQQITQEQADADLLTNLQEAVDAVNLYVSVPLRQSQFDSLVDLTFNCGVSAFKHSTLLRKLNALDYDGACDEFDRWVFDNGKVIPGLVRRRDAEQVLWDGDIRNTSIGK